MNGKNKKGPVINMTKTALIIRALVAAYILYLAYSITTSEGPKSIIIWIGVTIFVVAGVLLIAQSFVKLARGEYIGGSADTDGSEDENVYDTEGGEEVSQSEESSSDDFDTSKGEIIEEVTDAEEIKANVDDIIMDFDKAKVETASGRDVHNLD